MILRTTIFFYLLAYYSYILSKKIIYFKNNITFLYFWSFFGLPDSIFPFHDTDPDPIRIRIRIHNTVHCAIPFSFLLIFWKCVLFLALTTQQSFLMHTQSQRKLENIYSYKFKHWHCFLCITEFSHIMFNLNFWGKKTYYILQTYNICKWS